jgi:fluoride ion exporter CrcB/FEX
MAQYFGLECQNPGSVGWLKASQPLCVTADGEASIEGGIIYADLPANLLGSFLMGLMQTTDALDLPKTFPIAWLRDSHPFQSDHVLHLAIRVGFCGSLTTFSSWNSEMVVMSFGEGPDGISLFFRAMLGYFIGVETALAAFVLGRNVAKYMHGRVNPAFEKEAHEEKRKRAEGVYINSHLSDYERQFLSGYEMDEHTIYIDADAAEFLARWKYSTDENRRVSDRLLPLLTDIECQTLGAGEFIDKELELEGREAGWDMDALACWVDVKNDLYLGSTNSAAESTPFRLFTALLWICCILGFLLFFIFTQNDDTAVSVTYRTMMYAVLFAPAGALLRWKLSSWNGSYKDLVWFPIGTFTANLIACILSAIMIGVEYRMEMYGYFGFWSLGTVRAAKIGFSGCLSTVSTFISEFHTFLNSSHPWKGYTYVTITLGLSFICGVVPYFLSSGVAVTEYYD